MSKTNRFSALTTGAISLLKFLVLLASSDGPGTARTTTSVISRVICIFAALLSCGLRSERDRPANLRLKLAPRGNAPGPQHGVNPVQCLRVNTRYLPLRYAGRTADRF